MGQKALGIMPRSWLVVFAVLLAQIVAVPAFAGKYATVRRYPPAEVNRIRGGAHGRPMDIPTRSIHELNKDVRESYKEMMRHVVDNNRTVIEQIRSSDTPHKLNGADEFVNKLDEISKEMARLHDDVERGGKTKPAEVEALAKERERVITEFVNKNKERKAKRHFQDDGINLRIALDPEHVASLDAETVGKHSTSGGDRPVDDTTAPKLTEESYNTRRDAAVSRILDSFGSGLTAKQKRALEAALLKELKKAEDAREKAGFPRYSDAELAKLEENAEVLRGFHKEVTEVKRKVPTDKADTDGVGKPDVVVLQLARNNAPPNYYAALRRYIKNRKAMRGLSRFAEVEKKLMDHYEAMKAKDADFDAKNPDYLANKLGEWLDLDINGHKALDNPEVFSKWLASAKVEDVPELKRHYKPRGLCNRIKGNGCWPGAIKCRRAA